MSNRKRGPSNRALVIVSLLCVAVVASLAAYVKYTPANRVTKDDPILVKKLPAPEVKIESGEEQDRHVQVFVPYYEGSELKFSTDEIVVRPGEDEKIVAVNEFLKASKVVDDNARLLGIGLTDGIATLSFNEAFAGGYGTEDEHVLLEGLGLALGQFPEIEKVILTIDGKPIETLGNVEISEGISVKRASTLGGASQPPQTH